MVQMQVVTGAPLGLSHGWFSELYCSCLEVRICLKPLPGAKSKEIIILVTHMSFMTVRTSEVLRVLAEQGTTHFQQEKGIALQMIFLKHFLPTFCQHCFVHVVLYRAIFLP